MPLRRSSWWMRPKSGSRNWHGRSLPAHQLPLQGGFAQALDGGPVQAGGAQPGPVHDPHAPQHQERQHGVQQQVRQQPPREQLARLGDVGAQHVAHHRRVEVDAKALHEVAGERGAHDQHRQQRFEPCMDDAHREGLYHSWLDAVRRVRS